MGVGIHPTLLKKKKGMGVGTYPTLFKKKKEEKKITLHNTGSYIFKIATCEGTICTSR